MIFLSFTNFKVKPQRILGIFKALLTFTFAFYCLPIFASKTTPMSAGPAEFIEYRYEEHSVRVAFIQARINAKTPAGLRWLETANPISGEITCTLKNDINTKTFSVPIANLRKRLGNNGQGYVWEGFDHQDYSSKTINYGAYYGRNVNVSCSFSNLVLEDTSGKYVDARRDLVLEPASGGKLAGWVRFQSSRVWHPGGEQPWAGEYYGPITSYGDVVGLNHDMKTLDVKPYVYLTPSEKRLIATSNDKGYGALNVNITGETQGLQFQSGSLAIPNGMLRWDGRSDINVEALSNYPWTPGENKRLVTFTVSYP